MKKSLVRSLYIHFPYCRHKCNYCDFYKQLIDESQEFRPLEIFLEKSFEGLKNFHLKNNSSFTELETLYIGGGTPSLWGEAGVKYLSKLLGEIGLSKSGEHTLEVNPGAYTKEGIKRFEEFGINRFSIGLQSLDKRFLSVLDRVHTIEDSFRALEFFSNKKANFSVDLMLGLPHSELFKRDVISELKEILTYNPSHISLYILTVNKKYQHYDSLPSEEWIEKEYLNVSEYLQENGFNHYEVSNFAKNNLESRHNLKYWKGENVAALGPSATGILYSDQNAIRYKWKTQKPEFVVENLDQNALLFEKIYLELRLNYGLNLDEFYKLEELVEAKKVSKSWAEKGLAIIDNNTVKLTPRGFLVMDSLINDLMNLDLI